MDFLKKNSDIVRKIDVGVQLTYVFPLCYIPGH